MNDTFDIEVDHNAGKSNIASQFSKLQRTILALLLISAGFAIWIVTHPSFLATVFLFFEVIVLIIYPTPPLRLKNHPFLGPVCDAHYSHILPVFITIAYFLPIFFQSHLLIPTLIYLLLFAKGFRNILLHQLDDRKSDRLSGLNTFPIRYGNVFTINLINRLILIAEFGLLISILTLLWPESIVVGIGLLGFLVFTFFLFSGWKLPTLPYRQLKFKFLFFLNDFYEFWLPYLCIWSIPINIVMKIILTIIHSTVFYRGVKKIVQDLKTIAINTDLTSSS